MSSPISLHTLYKLVFSQQALFKGACRPHPEKSLLLAYPCKLLNDSHPTFHYAGPSPPITPLVTLF